MKRIIIICSVAATLILVFAKVAAADYLDGVITSYNSGNQGTDMYVKSNDGHNHRLWFDNMKKPLFLGKQLPWCPEFPCDGWPAQLVLNKTHVRVYVVKENVKGELITSPTRIDLLPH